MAFQTKKAKANIIEDLSDCTDTWCSKYGLISLPLHDESIKLSKLIEKTKIVPSNASGK